MKIILKISKKFLSLLIFVSILTLLPTKIKYATNKQKSSHQCRMYRSHEKSCTEIPREICNMPNRLKCVLAPVNSFKFLMSKLTKIKFKLAG